MRIRAAVMGFLLFGCTWLPAMPGFSQEGAPSKDLMEEYQQLKQKGDKEAQKAMVDRVSAAYLAKRLEFMGSRKALFPKEVLERQLRSTIELVLEEGSNPDVRAQSAQWKWVDIGVAGLSALILYDYRFLDQSNQISSLAVIESSLTSGYMESIQKYLQPVYEGRKELLRRVESPLMRARGGVNKDAPEPFLKSLKELEEVMNKETEILGSATEKREPRIQAILRLRTAFKGLGELQGEAETSKSFPATSEGGRLLASLTAKERAYTTRLVALVKAKTTDPELKLAAASAWTNLEVLRLTQSQIQELLKDRFQGAPVPGLSRYADLPRVPAAPARKAK